MTIRSFATLGPVWHTYFTTCLDIGLCSSLSVQLLLKINKKHVIRSQNCFPTNRTYAKQYCNVVLGLCLWSPLFMVITIPVIWVDMMPGPMPPGLIRVVAIVAFCT
jgi:hypothetical protein